MQAIPPAAAFEMIDVVEAVEQLSEATSITPLPVIPFIVLTRGVAMPLADDPSGEFSRRAEAGWAASHDMLVDLAPGGQLIVATESGHYIMLEQPDLVIEAIVDVVEASRDEAMPEA